MKFRKKPVEISAWCNTDRAPHRSPMPIWLSDAVSAGTVWWSRGDCGHFTIQTLEGNMRADYGDWIIRGVKGELYPCKPDIFAATYEPILETEDDGSGDVIYERAATQEQDHDRDRNSRIETDSAPLSADRDTDYLGVCETRFAKDKLAATQEQCGSPGQDEREKVADHLDNIVRAFKSGMFGQRDIWIEALKKAVASLRTPTPTVSPASEEGLVREAYQAGYWRFCGPTNDQELDNTVEDEEEGWREWQATNAHRLSPPSVSPDKAEGCVPVQRWWLQRTVECLGGPLPSGHIGDVVFLLRDQITDILARNSSPPATEGEL
jgi:hypothetical protein